MTFTIIWKYIRQIMKCTVIEITAWFVEYLERYFSCMRLYWYTAYTFSILREQKKRKQKRKKNPEKMRERNRTKSPKKTPTTPKHQTGKQNRKETKKTKSTF